MQAKPSFGTFGRDGICYDCWIIRFNSWAHLASTPPLLHPKQRDESPRVNTAYLRREKFCRILIACAKDIFYFPKDFCIHRLCQWILYLTWQRPEEFSGSFADGWSIACSIPAWKRKFQIEIHSPCTRKESSKLLKQTIPLLCLKVDTDRSRSWNSWVYDWAKDCH